MVKSTLATCCHSSVSLGSPYCTRPQGSFVVGSLDTMLSAARLNCEGSTRFPTNGVPRLRCTPALHAGDANAVKSPCNIAAVGTNARLSVGFTVVLVP